MKGWRIGGARWLQALIGIALLVLTAALRLADPVPVEALRLAYFDQLQRLKPREAVPVPVRVIDIDEASLAEIGQWPWPRDVLARMVDRLAAEGAAVVAFDVLFAEPDRLSPARLIARPEVAALLDGGLDPGDLATIDHDVQFARAMSEFAVVLSTADVGLTGPAEIVPRLGVVALGNDPASGLYAMRGATPILPVLADQALGIGVISVSPGGGAQTVRRVPLLWRTEAGPLPALSLEALRVATGESTVQVRGAADLEGVVDHLRLGDFEIPTTGNGEIWFYARPDTAELYVSAADLLRTPEDPALGDRLAGHIVLVGTSAAGLLDIRRTPLGQDVPGVSIHAQLLEQILLGAFLTRDDLVQGGELLAFLVLGLLVILFATRFGPLPSMLVGAIAGAAVLTASWLAFARAGVLFDATFPLLAGLFTFGGLAAWQFVVVDREKRLIRRSFSHYVAPEVLTQIEQSGHDLTLGGETREITIMFCDIRDFTPLSETMAAADLVDFLNELFDSLGAEILDERGTIDKFIGDAIMAFWNAPLETRDHAARACRAALGMRSALAALNADPGRRKVGICIGINTGSGCVGNIGSRDRYNYSVIGDAVNVAARVEAACRPVGYDIVVAEPTARGADGLALLPAGAVVLKGKSDRLGVFAVVGGAEVAASAAFADLARRHEGVIEALALGQDVHAACAELAETAALIEPGLRGFYERLPDRRADFAPSPAAT